MIGTIDYEFPHQFDMTALDRAMAQLLGEDIPAPMPGSNLPEGLAQRITDWSLAIQRQVRIPVFGHGKTHVRPSLPDRTTIIDIATPTLSQQATLMSMNWVGAQVASFIATGQLAHPDASFNTLLDKLREFRAPGINTFRLLEAAHALNIPVTQIFGELYRFGNGSRARWLNSTITDQTSMLGVQIASDKVLTADILRKAGFPAATHLEVTTVEQAVQAARQIGFPVVVKPADQERGIGVAAHLINETEVINAYAVACQHSSRILVERHVSGQDYRLTVLHGKLIKTFLRRPAGVIGDGHRSIHELLNHQQQDPQQQRYMRMHGVPRIQLDDEAQRLLNSLGLHSGAIPQAGQFIPLRRRANISAGGTTVPIDPVQIHPDNQILAERAAKLLHLDLAGIDLILPDISRSWTESDALICEINAQPQIGASNSPHIYEDILRALLPSTTQLPLMVIVAPVDLPECQPLIEKHVPANLRVGFSNADGVWLGHRRIAKKTGLSYAAAQILLSTPEADAAIAVISPQELRTNGMPANTCELLVYAQSALDEKLQSMLLPHAMKKVVIPALEETDSFIRFAQEACLEFLSGLQPPDKLS